MPTGYTADIQKGITFNQFAMQCARAFGALVMMRDEAVGAEIPKRFEPSNYHSRKILELEKELDDLDVLTPSEWKSKADAEYTETRQRLEAGINSGKEIEAKYRAMLSEVRAWIPPTSDHEGMKDFMIKQIEDSIEFDCSARYYTETMAKQKKLTGPGWLGEKVGKIQKDLEYHRAEHAKEVERTESRNAWLDALRQSLEKVPA